MIKPVVQISGSVGVEVELIAPKGASRKALADAIAQKTNGKVHRFFHPQSEHSKIPGTPILENLTLGFEVVDAQGQPVAKCVDDLTLQADCDRKVPPKPGWYRIVSDDLRLLKLVSRVADPEDSVTNVLNPVADLFGAVPQVAPNGMVKVEDGELPPIAIAAPLPGERERPCELITPPLKSEDLSKLDDLLQIAQKLSFTAPAEGATHLHFDAAPLCDARVFKNLVNLLWAYGPYLRRLVATNSRCRRLGSLPVELIERVQQEDWTTLSWQAAVEQLHSIKLTKYCDFNLRNIVYAPANKHTFEARIFPVWLTVEPFYQAIGLIEAVLQRAQSSRPVSFQSPQEWDLLKVEDFFAELSLPDNLYQYWQSRISHC